MKANEAAKIILEQVGRPLKATEIVELAFKQGLIASHAKDSVKSFAQTIEKNIREGRYNTPRLEFRGNGRRGDRLIALPSMEQESETEDAPQQASQLLSVSLPAEIFESIQLATQAKIAGSFNETVILLLKKGLASVADDVRQALLNQLGRFEE
jgi:hypothetical protein